MSIVVVLVVGPICVAVIFALAAARDACLVSRRRAPRPYPGWDAGCAAGGAAGDIVEVQPV